MPRPPRGHHDRPGGNRRGTVYVMLTLVLAVSLACAVGGLVVRGVQLDRVGRRADAATARTAAWSALEAALADTVGTEVTGDASGTVAKFSLGDALAIAALERAGPGAYRLRSEAARGIGAAELLIEMRVYPRIDHEAVRALGPGLYFPLDDPTGSTDIRELVRAHGGRYATEDAAHAHPRGPFAPAAMATPAGLARVPRAGEFTADHRTVAFWFMAERAGGPFQPLYSEADEAEGASFFTIGVFANQFTVRRGKHRFTANRAEPINDGEWYHAAYVFDSERHALYINGEPAGTRGRGRGLGLGLFDDDDDDDDDLDKDDAIALLGAQFIGGEYEAASGVAIAGLVIAADAWSEGRVRDLARCVRDELHPLPMSLRAD